MCWRALSLYRASIIMLEMLLDQIDTPKLMSTMQERTYQLYSLCPGMELGDEEPSEAVENDAGIKLLRKELDIEQVVLLKSPVFLSDSMVLSGIGISLVMLVNLENLNTSGMETCFERIEILGVMTEIQLLGYKSLLGIYPAMDPYFLMHSISILEASLKCGFGKNLSLSKNRDYIFELLSKVTNFDFEEV